MSYIFLDESGDLGLDLSKKRTTKYFLVTFLFSQNKHTIESIVKKIHRKLHRTHKNFRGILHANSEKAETKLNLLNLISKSEINIMTIYLNKIKSIHKIKKRTRCALQFCR